MPHTQFDSGVSPTSHQPPSQLLCSAASSPTRFSSRPSAASTWARCADHIGQPLRCATPGRRCGSHAHVVVVPDQQRMRRRDDLGHPPFTARSVGHHQVVVGSPPQPTTTYAPAGRSGPRVSTSRATTPTIVDPTATTGIVPPPLTAPKAEPPHVKRRASGSDRATDLNCYQARLTCSSGRSDGCCR